jgi:hypothetical protein
MAIVINRNQSAIFGKIDGQKFSNVPFTKENFEALDKLAKDANTAKTKEAYDFDVLVFLEAVEKLNGKEPEVKKEVKVGNGNLTIVHLDNNKREVIGEYGFPYLFNGKVYSKFFIPKEIYARIKDSESKGVDTTPYFKFLIRTLRGEVLTQEKFNRISRYITKTWVDPEEKARYIEEGFSQEEATKKATVDQVGITQEGLLVTYKVSTLIGEGQMVYPTELDFDDDLDDDFDLKDECDEDEDQDNPCEGHNIDLGVEDDEPEVDLSEFVYQPKRNNKGHFYKKGSEEYVAEYNLQLEAFKDSLPKNVKATTTIEKKVDNKVVKEKVPANTKMAEDYLFQPAYQGTSGDAFYSGDKLGHTIQVGKRHYLASWSQVNTDDSTSARPGLHVGGLDYIRGIHEHHDNRVVHNIFVDPQYIGAVVEVENGDGAMRVKEYFVHSSFIGPNRGLYHSSTYAAQTDEEWNKAISEATETVKQAEERIAAIRKEAEKAQFLLDNTLM